MMFRNVQRRLLFPLLLLAGLLAALPAPAQTARGNATRQSQANEAACRSQCLAEARQPGGNATTYQACMIRCQAGQRFGATNRATGTGRPTTAPPAQRAPGAAGLAAGAAGGAALGAGAAYAAAPRGYGAIYGTPAPAAVAGMAVGQGDRLAAHRLAEGACMRQNRGNCRLIAEFTARCGAVAEVFRRSPGALFMTDDPASRQIIALAQGSGGSQAEAESAARADCARREPTAQCRITLSACGAG